MTRLALKPLLRRFPIAASLILAAPAGADEGGRFHSDIGLSCMSGQQKFRAAASAAAGSLQ